MPRAADDESVIFQTDEELVVPTGSSRGVRRRARRQDRPPPRWPAPRREPSGCRHDPVRQPAVARQRAPARLRSTDRKARVAREHRLLAPLRGATSIRTTRRSCGRHPARTASGTRRSWSATRPARSFLAAARSRSRSRPRRPPNRIASKTLHWLRCRLNVPKRRRGLELRARARDRDRNGRGRRRDRRASHAATVDDEPIGTSSGRSGHLVPASAPAGAGARAKARRSRSGSAATVDGSRGSASRHSRRADRATATSSSTRPRARSASVPRSASPTAAGVAMAPSRPQERSLRFTRYRHGGGRAGNVAAADRRDPARRGSRRRERRRTLRAAFGGVDAESLESARERARLEIRSRSRAVTAEDFERLTLAASPDVARAVCVAPATGEPIRVHVLPRLAPADRRLELAELTPSEELMQTVAAALERAAAAWDEHPSRARAAQGRQRRRRRPRLAARRPRARPAGRRARALRVSEPADRRARRRDLATAGRSGRAVNQGELFGIVYSIDGVEFVNVLRMYETDLAHRRAGRAADRESARCSAPTS